MIDLILGLLSGSWGPIAAIVGALMGAGGLYVKGRRDRAKDAENKRLKEQMKTRKEMDNVEIDDDAGVAREFLRSRGK